MTLAAVAGCAGAPVRPAPAVASAAAGAPPPPSIAAPAAARACSGAPPPPFTVIPQSGMGGGSELQFSKDGRIAAAKPSPLEIQLWSVASGNKVAVIAPVAPIAQWSLRPDGRMVAIVSEGRLSLVDPAGRSTAIAVAMPANVERVDWRADGKVLFATRGHETSVVDAAGAVTATVAAVSAPGGISADGRFLFSREGALWDVATNQSRWKAAGPSTSVAFSDDGQHIALASSQAFAVHDSATGSKRWDATTRGGLASEIALSPDGQSVAAYDSGESTDRGLENRGMTLWSRGKRTRVWQPADALATRPSFSPDGKLVGFIATGNNGVELRLADARTGARVKQPKNTSEIRADPPRWSADGRTLFQPGVNGLVVFDLSRGAANERRVFGKSSTEASPATTTHRDAVWSPDDGAILILADQGSRSVATIVDLKTGAPRESLEGKRFRAAEWNAATGLIAIDRSDGVSIWDGHAKQPLRAVDASNGDISERQIAFSPQGHLLATLATPNKEVRLWDPKTGARVRALGVAGPSGEDGTPAGSQIEAMAFSADGSRIALRALLTTGGEQSTHIAIFDTASGALVRTLHARRHYTYGVWGGRNALQFTPQGRGIVSIDATGRVDLWNASNDDPPTTLIEKTTPGPSTFADSGNLLLMGSPGLDVWDLRTRTLTRQLRGDGTPVVGAHMARGAGAIAITRADRVDLHRLADRSHLTLRLSPAGPSIVADSGAFAGALSVTEPLRAREGTELEVRSLKPNEVTALQRPSLALDFVAGCPIAPGERIEQEKRGDASP